LSESKTNTNKTYKDIDSEDQSNSIKENDIQPLDDVAVEKAIELFRKVREGGNVDLTEKEIAEIDKKCEIIRNREIITKDLEHKSIEITRDTTTKDNLSFFNKIADIIKNENRPLLIFPQGTRVKFEERIPFKKGAGRIYEALNIPCVPVALNSGKVWPKIGFIKYPGKITVSFLQPIEPGIDRETFLRILEKKIYDEMDAIK